MLQSEIALVEKTFAKVAPTAKAKKTFDPVQLATEIKTTWPAVRLMFTTLVNTAFLFSKDKTLRDKILAFPEAIDVLLNTDAPINFGKIKVKK